MKRIMLARCAALAATILLLAACGGKGGNDDDQGGDAKGVALVSTVMPVQQRFHDSVEAWGSATADPHHARTISLAHGGQVVALKVSAGQTVKRGDALLSITPDPTARSAYQQAQSTLTLASGELQRTEQMAAQHLATQSQVAAARKALSDAQSALAAQQALGGGTAQETVSAPDDGVVASVSVALGDRFAANAPLLGFMPAHALVAELGVQPDAGAQLHAGMPVQLHGVYGNAKPFAGTLTMVGSAIDPQTHLLPLQAEIAAGAGATLVAGAALDATIQSDDYTAWAVPRAAVLNDEQGDYLFQLDHDKAHRVDVQLRQPEGDTVGVLGKLDAKLPVIVQGAYEVDDGAAVRTGDGKANDKADDGKAAGEGKP
ncbi:efflux RND transporter periplasmic adaptor subunit [Rhodanobacter sp. DHB23]|uniref:efflux RND transporter periplasmic adaptor subunit n=1 Tax=Rhodanobacter sp. DHB23 TaxID=2775923 RepID=UPI00177CBEC4|nr:efflux RND transporter periplasmic adaptor subunit [Rhodanobacter sp. DHB23]MBD8873139.1 efflux RND transporter periplasmic adaptor subunit [Rhodanobacter sp. DHB23]